jgi:hypothetical protein
MYEAMFYRRVYFMKRVILSIFFTAALSVLIGCSSSPGSSGSSGSASTTSAPLSTTNAQALTGNIMTAISDALTNAVSGISFSITGTKSRYIGMIPVQGIIMQSRFTTNISYIGNGYSISGSETSNATNESANLTITFNNYTDKAVSGLTLTSGTVTLTGSENLTGSPIIVTVVYAGNLDIIYQNTSYTYSWDLTAIINLTAQTGAINGTFTINNYNYTISESGPLE